MSKKQEQVLNEKAKAIADIIMSVDTCQRGDLLLSVAQALEKETCYYTAAKFKSAALNYGITSDLIHD